MATLEKSFRYYKLCGELHELADKYGVEFATRQAERLRRLGDHEAMIVRAGNVLKFEALKFKGAPLPGFRPSPRWQGFQEPNRRTQQGREAAKMLIDLVEPGPLELFEKLGVQEIEMKTPTGRLRETPMLVGNSEQGWAVKVPVLPHYQYVPVPEMVEITQEEFVLYRRPRTNF